MKTTPVGFTKGSRRWRKQQAAMRWRKFDEAVWTAHATGEPLEMFGSVEEWREYERDVVSRKSGLWWEEIAVVATRLGVTGDEWEKALKRGKPSGWPRLIGDACDRRVWHEVEARTASSEGANSMETKTQESNQSPSLKRVVSVLGENRRRGMSASEIGNALWAKATQGDICPARFARPAAVLLHRARSAGLVFVCWDHDRKRNVWYAR